MLPQFFSREYTRKNRYISLISAREARHFYPSSRFSIFSCDQRPRRHYFQWRVFSHGLTTCITEARDASHIAAPGTGARGSSFLDYPRFRSLYSSYLLSRAITFLLQVESGTEDRKDKRRMGASRYLLETQRTLRRPLGTSRSHKAENNQRESNTTRVESMSVSNDDKRLFKTLSEPHARSTKTQLAKLHFCYLSEIIYAVTRI